MVSIQIVLVSLCIHMAQVNGYCPGNAVNDDNIESQSILTEICDLDEQCLSGSPIVIFRVETETVEFSHGDVEQLI